MEFLRWVGGIILFTCALGPIFKFGGDMAPLLLILDVVVYGIAMTYGRKRKTS